MTRPPPQIDYFLRNPEIVRQEMAERSLHEFIRQFWHVVDATPFIDGWHIRVICEFLEAVTRREIKRAIINIPPRHSKSTIVSVMWPAWVWLQNPGEQFLAASYSQTLSIRDNVKCRRIIESPPYQERWGERFALTSDQNTKIRFENDKNGYRISTSVGGTLTGEGGSTILIDDPISALEASSPTVRQSCLDWYDSTMSTRLNSPETGVYVVIMQRLHQQDLTGHLLEKGGWEILCLPARYEHDHPNVSTRDKRTEDRELLCPERFNERAVRQLETDLGSYAAAGQLAQRPAPREGGMFQKDWFEVVDAAPAGGQVVRGWDLASSTKKTSSWTASSRIKRVNKVFYIEDVTRFRGSPGTVEEKFKNTTKQDGPDVTADIPQDPGQAGKSQVRYMVQQLPGYNVRFSPESGDKEVRATPLSAQAEAGNVKLVRGAWNATFLEEAEIFPNSDYKDQVDAASRAFNRLVGKKESGGVSAPILISGAGVVG